MSASWTTISNRDSFSSIEMGVNPEIGRRKMKTLSERARCQAAIGGISFTKKK
jgi:hypothetical protein